MWRIRSCCFLSLRTGVVLIVILDFIHVIFLWYSWQTMPFLYGNWHVDPNHPPIVYGKPDREIHQILLMIFCMACVRLGFCFFLLCGNINGDKSLMKPYVHMTATLMVTVNICILLVLIINVVDTGDVRQARYLLPATLIWTVETLFYWQVVRSRIMEIDDEEAALDQRIATMLSSAMKATV